MSERSLNGSAHRVKLYDCLKPTDGLKFDFAQSLDILILTFTISRDTNIAVRDVMSNSQLISVLSWSLLEFL